MSGTSERAQPEREAAVRKASSEFQEVPGEAEAAEVSSAFMAAASHDRSGLAPALAQTGGGVRRQALERLQRERGNEFVQRMLAGEAVQRVQREEEEERILL
jgi:hypothetical protein